MKWIFNKCKDPSSVDDWSLHDAQGERLCFIWCDPKRGWYVHTRLYNSQRLLRVSTLEEAKEAAMAVLVAERLN